MPRLFAAALISEITSFENMPSSIPFRRAHCGPAIQGVNWFSRRKLQEGCEETGKRESE
jgi:hypothetical protein